MRRPTPARIGLASVPIRSIASPIPTGRSMHSVVVSVKLTLTPYSSASVASITSFCTSP